jgi:hypothetical protein
MKNNKRVEKFMKKEIKLITKEVFSDFVCETFCGTPTENEIDRLIENCGEQISKVLSDYFLCDESIQYFKNEIIDLHRLKIPNTLNVDDVIKKEIRKRILSDFLKKDILNKYLTI